MLNTSLMHHVNIAHKTCVMEKCGIALIGCFNDTFCIQQSYSVRSDQKTESHVVREPDLASFLIVLFFREVCSVRGGR